MSGRLMGSCCAKLRNCDKCTCCGNDKCKRKNSDDSGSFISKINFSIIVNNRWKLIREIGKGGYGKVYLVDDVNRHGNFYAMKIEKMREKKCGRLPQEALVTETMTKLGVTRHIVNVYDKGMITDPYIDTPAQFMVMTLLGPSLADLRKLFPSRKFSAVTTALVGIQAIEAIEDVHLVGYVHRDIKPHNFLLGIFPNRRLLYLIDFGMARKIIDNKGNLLRIRTNRKKIPFRGTMKYSAPGVQEHCEYSRHFDLWSLLYTLIELREGNLPWQMFEGNRKDVGRAKRRIIAQRWLKNVEREYLTFYEYLTPLYYDIRPNYEKLTTLLMSILKREKADFNTPFDWEPGSRYHNRIIKRDKLKNVFHENLIQSPTCSDLHSSASSA